MVRDGLLGSIVKLEYVETSAVSLFPNVLVSGETDGYILLSGDNEWTNLNITPDKSGIKWSRSGFISDATAAIDFKVYDLNATNRTVLEALKEKELIFRATDAHGNRFLLGSTDFPAFLDFDSGVGARAAQSNGFEVKVKSSTPDGAVLELAPDIDNVVFFNGLYLLFNGQYITFNG